MSALPIVPYPEPFPDCAGMWDYAKAKRVPGASWLENTSPVLGIPLHVEHHARWWCGACGAPLTNHFDPCSREMDLRTARLENLA